MTSLDAGRRYWLPAEWLDEVNPGMLESPDAYIERDGELWTLRLPHDDPDRDSEFFRMIVEPGQVVEFMWTEHYGDRHLKVSADRTWSLDQPVPEMATHVFEYSQGILADSVEELVSADPDCTVYDPLEPGEYVISTYTWSDHIPFRFEVDADGGGHFVQCAGAN